MSEGRRTVKAPFEKISQTVLTGLPAFDCAVVMAYDNSLNCFK
jgi:hypothetical protein